MFLPKSEREVDAEKASETEKKKAINRIEQWSMKFIPATYREGVQVSAQEILCGDPQCAPVDTAIVMMFPSGGRGTIGVPAEARDITEDDLREFFPPERIIAKWHRGEDADWPNLDDQELEDEDQYVLPQLRFDVGEEVQCRVGPDPVTGWAEGTIVQLWYTEQGWPPNSFAPYKIKLNDGRYIFAPGDVDQIIKRKEESRTETEAEQTPETDANKAITE